MSAPVAELGNENDIPAKAGSIESSGVALTPQDFFLWSRIDGATSMGALFRVSGQNRDGTVDSFRKLANAGLITLPNYVLPPPEPEPEPELVVPNLGVPFEDFEFDEILTGQESALPMAERHLLIYYHEHLRKVTYYELLDVSREARRREVSTAYYQLSKRFHPDTWFGQDLGAFDNILVEVFAWVSKAHRALSSEKRRLEYDRTVSRGFLGPWEEADADQASAGRATPKGPLGAQALVAQGRKFRSQGQHRKAADAFRRALRVSKEDAIALELIESLLEGDFDLDEALLRSRQLNRRGKRNYEAWLLEAKVLRKKGRVDEAAEIQKQLKAERPNLPGIQDLLESP